MTTEVKHTITINATLRTDPTRTATLRAAFEREMNRRFDKLAREIKESIVDNDCFGLSVRPPTKLRVFQVIPPRQFAFLTNEAKHEAFMAWLNVQVENGILELVEVQQLGQSMRAPWTNLYVKEAYQRGVDRGRSELINAGYNLGQAPENISAAFWNTPFHAERIGMLYTRAFSELKGITATMDSQISRVLATGLATGENPRRIASLLHKTLTGAGKDISLTDTLGRFIPAKRRAQMLARTEIIRTHHTATINEYKNWGAVGVKVQAEWSTAGWNVCPDCEHQEGRIYTLEEIETMIPFHPNCRCIALPLDITGGEGPGKVTPPKPPPGKVPPVPTPKPEKLKYSNAEGWTAAEKSALMKDLRKELEAVGISEQELLDAMQQAIDNTHTAVRTTGKALEEMLRTERWGKLGEVGIKSKGDLTYAQRAAYEKLMGYTAEQRPTYGYLTSSRHIDLVDAQELKRYGRFKLNMKGDVRPTNIYLGDTIAQPGRLLQNPAKIDLSFFPRETFSSNPQAWRQWIKNPARQIEDLMQIAELGGADVGGTFGYIEAHLLENVAKVSNIESIVIEQFRLNSLLRSKKGKAMWENIQALAKQRNIKLMVQRRGIAEAVSTLPVPPPVPPPPPLASATEVEKAKAEWEAFVEKILEQKTPPMREVLKERALYYRYMSLEDPKVVKEVRRSMLNEMMVPKAPRGQKAAWKKVAGEWLAKVEEGTNYIPFDMLDQLHQGGLRVNISFKQSGRAFWRSWDNGVYIYNNSSRDTIAHEFGHALDDMVFGQKMIFIGTKAQRDGTGMLWKDNAYTSQAEGDKFRGLYHKLHSGKKATYTNGDGDYWLDNWINDYEGRIYPGRNPMACGQEWISMNMQRYADYRYRMEQFGEIIERVEARMAALDAHTYPRLYESLKAEAERMRSLGIEGWSASSSEWTKVRRMYPDLAEFIEKQMGKTHTGAWEKFNY